MADRIPLILNTNANQIQEMPSGDTLDLTNSNINGVGILTVTTIDCNGDLDVDGHINFDNLSIAGVSTFSGVIEASAGQNKIPSLYNAMTDLPSAGTYHGMFAHVHATGRGYFSHAGGWYELVNKETTGVVGTGTERYNLGALVSTSTTATSLNVAGVTTAVTVDINGDLDVDGHTNLDNVSIAGVATATTFSGSGASLTNLNGSNIASGTVPVARIGTGTKNTSTFYRGDGTFATVTSTTINSNADNRIITGSGTANTLEGETTLTYDGTTLEATNSSFMIKGVDTNSNNSQCFIQFNQGKINLSADNNNATGASGIEFTVDGTYAADFSTTGFIPVTNNAIDLGSTTKRWRNVYTTDLQLSNEGKTNDVDGTWGNYTIQEGESDLFLINNRSGKKYKFNLTEVL